MSLPGRRDRQDFVHALYKGTGATAKRRRGAREAIFDCEFFLLSREDWTPTLKFFLVPPHISIISRCEKANGYNPSLTRTNPQIVSPSDSDTERSFRIRSEGAAHHQAQRSANPLNLQNPDELDLQIQAPAIISNTDRRFGSVFASSGSGRDRESAVDWALILLISPPRAGTNQTPPGDPFNTNGFGPTNAPIIQANDAESQSHAFPNATVFKRGRNGGSTGRIAPFKACIKRHADSGVVQKAMVVEEGRESDCYMLPGDEGCWGLNLLGAWDHLGVGVEREVGACYVVPTSELYKDVEGRTGGRIVSPVLGW